MLSSKKLHLSRIIVLYFRVGDERKKIYKRQKFSVEVVLYVEYTYEFLLPFL